MKKSSNDHSFKLDRKTVERNRRIRMKGLCFKLSSLIPLPLHNFSKDVLSQQDQIYQATAYITQLKERIKGLKTRKEFVVGNIGVHPYARDYNNAIIFNNKHGSNPTPFVPLVDLRECDSGLDLTVISGENKNFMLYKVISILEEEGAEVVSASISRVGDKFFHSIHAQVRICRLGVETARVCERLQDHLACSF